MTATTMNEEIHRVRMISSRENANCPIYYCPCSFYETRAHSDRVRREHSLDDRKNGGDVLLLRTLVLHEDVESSYIWGKKEFKYHYVRT